MPMPAFPVAATLLLPRSSRCRCGGVCPEVRRCRSCRSVRRSARAGVSVVRPAALSSLASLSLRSLGVRARAPRRFVARASVVTVTLRVLGAGRARALLSSLALA